MPITCFYPKRQAPGCGSWHTTDEAGEAATLGVVQVNVADLLIAEVALDLRCDIPPFAYRCADDHMTVVVRSQRHEAKANAVRYFARFQDSLLHASSDVDWARCLVRRVGGLVSVGQQQQLFADFGVRQADTAWEARLLLRCHSKRIDLGKLTVGAIEQLLKRLVWQTDQLKRGHGAFTLIFDAPILQKVVEIGSPLSDTAFAGPGTPQSTNISTAAIAGTAKIAA